MGGKILHCLNKVQLVHIYCKSPVAMFWLQKPEKKEINQRQGHRDHALEAKLPQRTGLLSLNHFYIVFII